MGLEFKKSRSGLFYTSVFFSLCEVHERTFYNFASSWLCKTPQHWVADDEYFEQIDYCNHHLQENKQLKIPKKTLVSHFKKKY